MSTSSPFPKKKEKTYIGRKVFITFLVLVTLGFSYVVVDYFYLDPLRQAGKPVYGQRLSELMPLDSTLIQSIETMGRSQEGIADVQISVQGDIVYLQVNVDSTFSLEQAQQETESLAQTFIQEMGETLEGYTLQLVVSSGETDKLLEMNREAELAYIKAHDVAIVEQVVAHTEKYPTVANIERSQANINLLKKSYPEEAEVFQTRLNALTPYTAEEEEKVGNIPTLVVNQIIQTSDIADYPTWGVWDVETSTVQWH